MIQEPLFTSSFSIFLKKYLLPVLLSLVVGGGVFSYLFEQKIILASEANGAYKVNRIINQLDVEEIPILGSSRAECSFVPGLISKHAFNYGLSGVQDNVILFFLDEEVKKNKTAPIIINFDLDGLSYSLAYRGYYLYNASYKPIKKLLGDEFKFRYNIPFIKYYGYYEFYLSYYLNDKMNLTKKLDHGGNFGLNVFTPKKFNELIAERIHTPTVFHNDSLLEQHLFGIIEAHPERTFVFILSPCHKSFFVSYQNSEGLQSYIKRLENYKNVRVIDMSHMPYPDTLYMNTSHLNYEGAKYFSMALRDSLLTAGIIR
jgi:hypothetical protein